MCTPPLFKGKKFTYIKMNAIEINLAGLTGNLNFLLLKFEGNDVEIDIILGDEIKKERGKIYNVGIDFIELKQKTV
jgi:hypothetical protein